MKRRVIILGCSMLVLAGVALPQIGHLPFGSVRIGMTFSDPNGEEHEFFVGTEAEWVEVRLDGYSVWMDWRQALAAAHYLNLAAEATTPREVLEDWPDRGKPGLKGGDRWP